MRRQKSASCFGEGGPFAIEIGLCYLIFGQLFTAQGLSELPQFGHSFLQFLYGVVTFEHGFMTTIGMMLFLYQIANYGKDIFPYSLTHSKHTHTHTHTFQVRPLSKLVSPQTIVRFNFSDNWFLVRFPHCTVCSFHPLFVSGWR